MDANEVRFTGAIVYKTPMKSTTTGNTCLFALKNEFDYNGKRFLGGLHCVAWREKADEMEKYKIGDVISVRGFAVVNQIPGARTKVGKMVYVTRCYTTAIKGVPIEKVVQDGHTMRMIPSGDIVPFDIDDD